MIKVTDGFGTKTFEHQILNAKFFDGPDHEPFTVVEAGDSATFVPGNRSIEIEYCEAE